MSKVQFQRRDRFEHRVLAHGTRAADRKERSMKEENQKKQTATECYFLVQTKNEALKPFDLCMQPHPV